MTQPPKKPTPPTVTAPATAPPPADDPNSVGPPNPALKPDPPRIALLEETSKAPGLDGKKNLKSACKVVLKMVDRNEEAAFPPDIEAKGMVEHLIGHGNSLLAKESTGKEAGAAAVTQNKRRREVRKALTRLEEIVDPRFPHSNPARASFFPATPGEHTEIERLSAMVDGIKKHGIGIMPKEYPLVVLEELLSGGTAAKGELDDAEEQTEGVSTTEVQQSLHTLFAWSSRPLPACEEGRRRLALIVRRIHGDDNPLLLEYGISPRVKGARGKGKSKAAPTPAKLQKQEANLFAWSSRLSPACEKSRGRRSCKSSRPKWPSGASGWRMSWLFSSPNSPPSRRSWRGSWRRGMRRRLLVGERRSSAGPAPSFDAPCNAPTI